MNFLYTAYRFFLHLEQVMVENELNKTLQASPAVRCCDAQTGGLLILYVPAMPLNDAHFGGCFSFGGCQ